MSRGWSHRALSFLLVGEMKGWLASLRAPGPCSGAPCWRKCSQNDSVAVAGTTVEHLYGIIAICTHVLVSLLFCFSGDLGKGLQNHSQSIGGLLAFVGCFDSLQLTGVCCTEDPDAVRRTLMLCSSGAAGCKGREAATCQEVLQAVLVMPLFPKLQSRTRGVFSACVTALSFCL